MTPDDLSEKVAAHDATLVQMNERLGNIEATLRDMNGRLATTGELRTWASVIAGLIAIAVGVMLKYG